ncbi:helix-turn-helix domain-containing protein [Actinomadura sp. 6N118]|uniref:helix-turn-helix domain-containing protein n=1 Tax=Actinomadura sp. 6N118 TaxID=3375151 RepID=UPI003788AF0E
MAKRPPTFRMRRLGAQLRKLREEHGLGLDEAADLLLMSKSALHRIENAQVTIRPREVNYILMTYGDVEADLQESLLGLAAAGRSKDWVKRYGDLAQAPVVGDYVRLEQDASALLAYQPNVIHGLFQTPDYARAIMSSLKRLYPDRDVDRSVAFRMARREVLEGANPARMEAVIGESAIRHQIGGPAVMHEQLHHLLDVSRRGNIVLRILPFEIANHPGADGAFSLLEVEAGSFTVCAVHSLTQVVFVDDESEVASYSVAFEELREASLSVEETRERIAQVLHELGTW